MNPDQWHWRVFMAQFLPHVSIIVSAIVGMYGYGEYLQKCLTLITPQRPIRLAYLLFNIEKNSLTCVRHYLKYSPYQKMRAYQRWGNFPTSRQNGPNRPNPAARPYISRPNAAFPGKFLAVQPNFRAVTPILPLTESRSLLFLRYLLRLSLFSGQPC